MDTTQLTTPQIIGLVIAWFVLGAAFDFFKILLTFGGRYMSFVPQKIKASSRTGRKYFGGAKNAKVQVVNDFVDTLETAFRDIKTSLLAWSMNFLRQVVKREDEGGDNAEEKGSEIIESRPIEQEKDEELSVFNNKPENKHAGQKVVGALIEFIALLAFLYADASQAAQTYSVLFPTATIPDWLNGIVVPLIVASAGTAFILGIFIGDALHLTHFGNWGNLKGTSRKVFFAVTISNLLVTILLSALVALDRSDILGVKNETIRTVAIYAQSFVIVPMLITTALLLRGAFGIFVLLAILLWLLAIPFAVFEFFIRILGKFLDLGIVSVEFVFSKLLWLTLGAFELVFTIIEKTVQGGFLVLIAITTMVFYIPYLVINLPIEKLSGGKRIKDFISILDQVDLQISDDDDGDESEAIEEEQPSVT